MATNIWPEDILAKTMTADAIALLARYLDPLETKVQMLCNENNLLCCAVVRGCTIREHHNQMWYVSSNCDYRRVLSVLFASGQTAYTVRWTSYWCAECARFRLVLQKPIKKIKKRCVWAFINIHWFNQSHEYLEYPFHARSACFIGGIC